MTTASTHALRPRSEDRRSGLVRWLGVQLALVLAAARSLTRRPLPSASTTHPYARASPHRWLPWFLLLSLPADALFVALVLPPDSDLVAWLLFAVTLYSLLWSLGVYRTMRERPHVVSADRVVLNNGALATITFAPSLIAAVGVHPGFPPASPKAGAYMRGAGLFLYGLGPFVEIRLHAPATVTTAWRDRAVSRVLVQADDPEALSSALQHA